MTTPPLVNSASHSLEVDGLKYFNQLENLHPNNPDMILSKCICTEHALFSKLWINTVQKCNTHQQALIFNRN